MDYRGLPGVTFTTPQIASAGLTEDQALAAGHACECRVLGAQDIPRALVNQDTRGVLKLVIDAEGLSLTTNFLPNSPKPEVKEFVAEWVKVRGAEPGQRRGLRPIVSPATLRAMAL